jgi:hypothetical protein
LLILLDHALNIWVKPGRSTLCMRSVLASICLVSIKFRKAFTQRVYTFKSSAKM